MFLSDVNADSISFLQLPSDMRSGWFYGVIANKGKLIPTNGYSSMGSMLLDDLQSDGWGCRRPFEVTSKVTFKEFVEDTGIVIGATILHLSPHETITPMLITQVGWVGFFGGPDWVGSIIKPGQIVQPGYYFQVY